MSFDLFGFDIIPAQGFYAIWIGCVTDSKEKRRCLFALARQPDNWRLDIFWMRIV